MATPDTLPFSHVISMPVATGYTCIDLKGIELGKEELHVLELKLKALISSRHQEHQGVAVAEAAKVRVCMSMYKHVHMCACVNSLVIT